MRSHPGPVTVFGGANIDHIGATKAPPVAAASNPGSVRSTPGGVGFNVASILARLGHPVRLATRVGRDREGEVLIDAAGKAGIDTDWIARSTERPTATYLAALDDTGALILGIAGMDICDEIGPASVAETAATAPAGDTWVVDANLPEDTIAFLVGEARSRDRRIVALAVSPAKALRLAPLVHDIDLLVLNRAEAMAILARDSASPRLSAAALAEALAGRPRPDVVVTDADAPLAAIQACESRSFAPLRATIRSVNGAGDALAAGLVHGLASGRVLFDSIRPGLAAAAITMEHEGTVPPTLTAAALRRRLGAGTGTESA